MSFLIILHQIYLKKREWICAQNIDGKYISTYAKDKPQEDLAESILPWVAITYRAERQKKNTIKTIRKTIPNRLRYFDQKLSLKLVE